MDKKVKTNEQNFQRALKQSFANFKKRIAFLFHSFFNLLYPNLCVSCGTTLLRSENGICTKCLSDIPRTNMHLQVNNAVEQRFWGKVKIEHGTAFYYFSKGSVFQGLLHQLKYKNNKEIGQILGRFAAADLLANNYFSDIDFIVPVPLHPKKFHKRGYNQSEWICYGLHDILQIPFDVTHLIRVRENTTQTKKSVYDRYVNTQGIFGVKNPKEWEGKHILIVDDVLTTGSTLEACIAEILKIPNTKVSVFTLAVA